MLFNSIQFLFVFLPIVFIIYFGLNKLNLIKLGKLWLICASLYFYSCSNIKYFFLIVFSMILNYTIGKIMQKNPENKGFILFVGIFSDIVLLAYFKYFQFIAKNINAVFSTHFNYMHLMLPLAISFITFQQIAYLVDIKNDKIKDFDWILYSLSITFFPKLIAGPITRYDEVAPQFMKMENNIINHKNISLGMFLIALGLFKKVYLANFLGIFVDSTFDIPTHLTFFESWLASLCYTFQIYFDFSGYCDIAIGIGYLFNIILPINFNSPYKADSIQDFWRRWHITLSRFLKDYIYIPLGGNRKGVLKTYRNLILTFLIGGLWHGANWTFIMWGFLHGIASCINKFFKNIFTLPKACSVGITFLFLNITWIFFRANNIHRAIDIIKSMIGLNGFESLNIDKLRFSFYNGDLKLSFFLFFGAIILLLIPNSMQLLKKFKPNFYFGAITLILIIATTLSFNRITEFIYFQF